MSDAERIDALEKKVATLHAIILAVTSGQPFAVQMGADDFLMLNDRDPPLFTLSSGEARSVHLKS
jgi:hypothetical protein